MRYSLVVPGRVLPALRSALGAFDRVQIQIVEEPDPDLRPEQVVRAELRLSRPSSEPPLTCRSTPIPCRPSPPSSRACAQPTASRRQVVVDLLPAAPAARRRLRRRLLHEARRRSDIAASGPYTGGLVGYIIGFRQHVTRTPAEVVAVRAEREEIAAKLLQAEPLFRTQVLIRCSSPEMGRAVACLQGLLGCIDCFAGANSLRVAGVRFLGLAFAGSDLPGLRAWFDRRMRTGLFRPLRSNYVSAREVAGLPKPPTVHCSTPEVTRLGPAVYPAPKSLPTFTGQRDVVPLGRVEDERGARRVGLRLEDSFFTYTARRSRWGKTELAITQFLHLVRSGHGGLFLDPHEDAIARIKSCLTEPQFAERVIELDLVGPRSRQGQPGWNLFAARGLDQEAAERRVEAIVDSFASAL